MIIVVDTENKTVTIDDKLYSDNLQEIVINNEPISLLPKPTLADEFAKHRGVYEYTGIVAEIQKWFYDKMVDTPWCATSLCYFANKLGILEQIGGKNNNVFNMMNACKIARPSQFYTKENLPSKILKGDILFMLWSGDTMTVNSSKHVCVAEYNSSRDKLYCIGGNQKDKICTLEYERKYIYAMFRPKY